MTPPRWTIPVGLLVLLLAAVVGLVLTREDQPATVASRWTSLVDQTPLRTARNLSALATGREETRFSRQALRIADHEVDLAFSVALRDAAVKPADQDPKTRAAFERVNRAQATLKQTQDRAEDLKKRITTANPTQQDALQQELSLALAQQELDEDELQDAKDDLLRSGNNPSGMIQRLFERHQSDEQHQAETQPQNAMNQPEAEYGEGSLSKQVISWRNLSDKQSQLQQAADQSAAAADNFSQKREPLQKRIASEGSARQQLSQQAAQLHAATIQPATGGAPAAAPVVAGSTVATIASLHQLAADQKDLADLSRRIRDHQELSDTYKSWVTVVQSHKRAALHGIIRSILLIVLIVLLVYEAGVLADRLFVGVTAEHKRLRTLRGVVRFALQTIGVLLIIFVVLGTPAQMPTILGLAGAGLTVALKDFIVAFFGWFVLMGRNGIHVGDWVEINGVVGEVAEINLMRTIILETGNWTDTGHPTGRKVAFMNGYAIEGHFFNFSTSGQWLWDEIELLVPSSEDPYPIIDAIQKLVSKETEGDAKTAEQEWSRATSHYRVDPVSLAPAINVRPTTSGVELHIRYITRANERFSTRTKLYTALVELLHKRQIPEAVASLQAAK